MNVVLGGCIVATVDSTVKNIILTEARCRGYDMEKLI